jgi:hypothetical protein
MERDEADKERAEVEVLRTRKVSVFAWATGAVAVAAGLLAAFARPTPRPDDAGDLRATQVAPATRAELVYTSGEVRVAGEHARVGRNLLTDGVTVETEEGTACVLVEPEINLCLAKHSKMRLSGLASSARRVDLEVGKVAARLTTQPTGMSVSIVAGDVWSTAVGTAFSVERSKDDGAIVTTVLNGKVRVGRDKQQGRIVTAHERSAVKAAHSELSAVSRTEEAPSWALLGPTVLWHDPVAATLHVRGEPSTAEAWLDGQSIGIAPVSTLVPVGAHRLLVRAAGEVLFDGEVRVAAGEVRTVEYQPKALPGPSVVVDSDRNKLLPRAHKTLEENAKVLTPEQVGLPADSVAAQQSPALKLSEARKLIREQRYADAARVYQELREGFPGSDEAHTVLVSLGQLQLSQLTDARQALRSLDTYLQRGGPLAEEARLTRVLALRALGDDARETAAIEEILAKHPRSLEIPTLRARLLALRPSTVPVP